MQRVPTGNWANPSAHKPTDWTQAAGDAGMMALAGISGDAKYRDAMLAMGGRITGNSVRACSTPMTTVSARLIANFIFFIASRR